jgi:hypothetical protein
MDGEARWSAFERARGAYAVGGLVFAYFLQPITRFADPAWFAAGGAAFAVAVGSIYADHVQNSGKIAWWLSHGMLITSLIILLMTTTLGFFQSGFNDRQCVSIQHHMFTTSSSRQDDAAMMQALGCRPHGDEMPDYSRKAPNAAVKPRTIVGSSTPMPAGRSSDRIKPPSHSRECRDLAKSGDKQAIKQDRP